MKRKGEERRQKEEERRKRKNRGGTFLTKKFLSEPPSENSYTVAV